MNLDSIDVFVEVVDAKSFTRAAERLGMPSTTVSARIARLEERLGVSLLRRTTRKLSLTEAGERYYVHCTLALDAMAQAERALARESETPSGTLRITAPADISRSLMPPIIEAYLHTYPDVSVDLIVSNSLRDLIGERIDLALRMGEIHGAGLIVRKFMTAMLTLWASPDYLDRHGPIKSPEDLQNHRLIFLKMQRDTFKMTWRGNTVTELERSSRLQVDDLQTCRSFLEKGLGIGLLPEFEPAGLMGYGALRKVLPGLLSQQVNAYFVYPQQRFVSPAVRHFIDTANEVVQRHRRPQKAK